jgi:hypothetical protein
MFKNLIGNIAGKGASMGLIQHTKCFVFGSIFESETAQAVGNIKGWIQKF